MNGDRVHKSELIDYIIRMENIQPAHTVMIGDRKHDILGAKQHAIRTLGVLYGYGSQTELIEAGADELATSPQAIVELLIR